MPKTTKTRNSSLLENLDRRLSNVEQILPTLATREELREAIAPLATREELREAIAPLATREELREAIAVAIAPLATRDEVRAEGRETRRHFDVIAESLRSDIRLIAEAQAHQTHRLDVFEARTDRALASLDRRVLRLEGKRSR